MYADDTRARPLERLMAERKASLTRHHCGARCLFCLYRALASLNCAFLSFAARSIRPVISPFFPTTFNCSIGSKRKLKSVRKYGTSAHAAKGEDKESESAFDPGEQRLIF